LTATNATLLVHFADVASSFAATGVRLGIDGPW
jgi:hypothetical protein